MNKFKDSLSIRSRNGLARCFGLQVLDAPEIIAARRDRFRLAVGLGHESLKEIAELLHKFGFIGNPDNWLDS